MRINSNINHDDVHLDLEAGDMQEALEAAARAVSESVGVPSSEIAEALAEREQLGSTSVGGGFAIPHCKLKGIKKIHLYFVRFREGIPFTAPDGNPVSVFFIVLSPPDQPAAHLQVLSQIARVLKRDDVRDELIRAASPDDLITVFQHAARTEGL